MSLVYTHQQEGNNFGKHFQSDTSEQKLNEVKSIGSNPTIIAEDELDNTNVEFDMTSEGLW